MQLSEIRRLSPQQTLFGVYCMGAVGAFLQIAGAQWDVSWHILGIVETFFTPAHAVLYAGIVLVAFANLIGLRFGAKVDRRPYSSLLTGVRIATVGSLLQILAAPFDFWWHSTFGFDPFLFTPAHSLLIVGMVLGGIGMGLGGIRLWQAQRSGELKLSFSSRSMMVVVFLALAAIWGQLNFLSYWITDVDGMAYTFRFCSVQQFRASVPCSFVIQFRTPAFFIQIALFAIIGAVIFLTSKSVLMRRGMFTSSALLLGAIYSTGAIGYTAYALEFLNPAGTWYLPNPSPGFGAQLASALPMYLLVLIPIVLLDLSIKNPVGKRRSLVIVISALVGPFVGLIDGRFFVEGILGADPITLTIFAALMVVGGLVGGLIFVRLLKNRFVSIPISSHPSRRYREVT